MKIIEKKRGYDDEGNPLIKEIRIKQFEKNPCIKTAWQVMVDCRMLSKSIPESVLIFIEEYFAKKVRDEFTKKRNRIHKTNKCENFENNGILLECALFESTLAGAYKLYNQLNENDLSDAGTLRIRLSRFLDKLLIHFSRKHLNSEEKKNFQIPNGLKKKVKYYRGLLLAHPDFAEIFLSQYKKNRRQKEVKYYRDLILAHPDFAEIMSVQHKKRRKHKST